jgi:putative aldouronate transport system substrate-binding protein
MKKGLSKWTKTAFVLLLSFSFAACGGNNSNGNNGGNGNDGGSGVEKPIEIAWLSYNPPHEDGTAVQKALEEKFNVKFKNIRVERGNYNEQLFTKISSGEIPDLIYAEGVGQLAKLAEQGVIAELPENEIRDHMPLYAETLDELDPTLWTYGLYNGKSYGIPLTWPIGNLAFLSGYNGEWLKNIGYDEPPKTLDEFEDVLRKFRNNDPDGNGEKDTYGISAHGADRRNFTSVFGAFQIRPEWMADADGVVYNAIITDRAREAFRLLNKWYEEDLIDPEFITKNGNEAHNDFYNGRVGIRDWMSFQFDSEVGIVGNGFYAKNPDNEIVVGKPLEGPYGPGTAYSYGSKNAFLAMGVQVEEDAAKKQKIYELLGALATDDETFLLSTYGIEGKHYDMVDGVAVSKDEYASEANKLTIGAGLFYGIFGQKSPLMEKYDYPKSSLEFAEFLDEGMKGRKHFPILFSVPDVTSKYPDLGAMESERYIEFITGEKNLDEDFDAFVEEWKTSGGQAITDAVNEKYEGIYATE